MTSLHAQWARVRVRFAASPEDVQALGRVSWCHAPTSAALARAALETRISRHARMRRGSARCYDCGDSTASICTACVLKTRDSLVTLDVRI